MSKVDSVWVIKDRFDVIPHIVMVDDEAYGVCITRGIADVSAVRKGAIKFIEESLVRHASGDWGEISQEDKEVNDQYPASAMSAYVFEGDLKIWIKTDADRFTVLLPEEY